MFTMGMGGISVSNFAKDCKKCDMAADFRGRKLPPGSVCEIPAILGGESDKLADEAVFSCPALRIHYEWLRTDRRELMVIDEKPQRVRRIKGGQTSRRRVGKRV